MLELIFRYDLEKDVENFINSTRAKNSSTPTPLQKLYMTENGEDYSVPKVTDFLKKYNTQIGFESNKVIKKLSDDWQTIASLFTRKAEEIFTLTYPSPAVTVYLTSNERCTYNIPQNYFFVCFTRQYPNRTIMHELLHFYTWHAFHAELATAGLNESQYNDIKESLTVLLNLEFSGLMKGWRDGGYPQHAEMRQKIEELWKDSKDIRLVIFKTLNLPLVN